MKRRVTHPESATAESMTLPPTPLQFRLDNSAKVLFVIEDHFAANALESLESIKRAADDAAIQACAANRAGKE